MQYFLRYLPELLGYSIILTIAPYLISLNINALWRKLKFQSKEEKFRSKWHPDYQARLDLIMYLTAILIGKPEFIIAWLGLKTIPQVVYWTKIKTLFNIFLIGNSLILIFAFITAEIIKLARGGRFDLVIIIGLSWVIFNLWTFWKTKQSDYVDIEEQKKALGGWGVKF